MGLSFTALCLALGSLWRPWSKTQGVRGGGTPPKSAGGGVTPSPGMAIASGTGDPEAEDVNN